MKKQQQKIFSIFSSSAPSTSTTGKEPMAAPAMELSDAEEADENYDFENDLESQVRLSLSLSDDEQDEEQNSKRQQKIKKRKLSHDIPRGGFSKFKPEYAIKFKNEMIEVSKKGNALFYCRACDDNNTFGKAGEAAIVRHINTDKHKKNRDAIHLTASMEPFIRRKKASEENKAIATELCLAFFIAKHNISLVSMQCLSKFIPQIFTGSNAERFASAATKTTALIRGVLHPFVKDNFVQKLNESGGHFSVAFDSTPHLNQRLHAIVVRYFDGKIRHKIVDIVSMAAERSVDMHGMIKEALQKGGLDFTKLVSLTGDNTNANFGGAARRGANNVFALLRAERPQIRGISCSAHVIHNAASFAASKMDCLDFESCAQTIASHFNGNARRWELFCDFAEQESLHVQNLPNHTSVRWLTLCRLVEAILKMWPVFRKYFKSVDDCPKKMRKIFNDEGTEKECELFALFNFAAFSLGHFNKFNTSTQAHCYTIAELLKDYGLFRDRLQGLLNDGNFGAKTAKALETMEKEGFINSKRKLERAFQKFYADSLNYLEKWFGHFDQTLDFPIQWLTFAEEFRFIEILEAYRKFFPCDEDEEDKLNEEVFQLKQAYNALKLTAFMDKNIEDKWATLLINKNLEMIKKLVSVLLSMFPSNAFCESVFSAVNSVWTDQRNSFLIETVNALISVKYNSEFECMEALNLFLSTPELLQKAKGLEKYSK